MGRCDNNHNRPIIARFTRNVDREDVLRNVTKLRGTRIFINEDLCPASNNIRKSQLPQLKQARSEGKVAFFRHTRLIIKERTTSSHGNQQGGEDPTQGDATHAGPSKPRNDVTRTGTDAGADSSAGASAVARGEVGAMGSPGGDVRMCLLLGRGRVLAMLRDSHRQAGGITVDKLLRQLPEGKKEAVRPACASQGVEDGRSNR